LLRLKRRRSKLSRNSRRKQLLRLSKRKRPLLPKLLQ
jgi:hypothetical protein